MSTTTAPAPTPTGGTSTAASGRTIWRRTRIPVLLLVVLVVASTVLALLRTTESGALDPRSFSPDGSRALAALLERQGLAVRVVGDVVELSDELEPGSTVFVPQPYALTPDELEAVTAGARDEGAALVVAGAESDALDALDLDVASTEELPDADVRDPECDIPYARRAGDARSGGVAYEDAPGCYPAGGDPTLVVLPEARTTLVGTVSGLTNDRLDEDGNAALGLGLLGERPDDVAPTEVLWVLPRPDRPLPSEAGGTRPLADQVPDGVIWGVVQLAVAIVVLGLWRARRLGRVVTEPLPVVVRGAESVEGRARLYRAAGARAQAAEALRAGSRDRLARAVGLPADAPRAGLVETLAARSGADPLRVDGLLYGPAPADDAALVRLADDLDALRP